MSTSKITISLDEPALAALDAAYSNRSGGIAHLIEMRAREARDAIERLRVSGWSPRALQAAAASLLGTFIDLTWSAEAVALELAACSDTAARDADVGEQRWTELCAAAHSDAALARAIVVVAQEAAAGNAMVLRAMASD